LPETTEADHHGRPSFRVRGRIFATVPDQEHLRIMVDEGGIHAAVAEHPAACQAFSWGKRRACVVVELAAIAPEQLAEQLRDAWIRNAAPALARTFADRRRGPVRAAEPPCGQGSAGP